jgi:hypothetical protein
MIWLLSTPYTGSKLDRRCGTQKDRERETTCSRERGAGGGRGSKLYDIDKAWSSINHTIFSGICMDPGQEKIPTLSGIDTATKNILKRREFYLKKPVMSYFNVPLEVEHQ